MAGRGIPPLRGVVQAADRAALRERQAGARSRTSATSRVPRRSVGSRASATAAPRKPPTTAPLSGTSRSSCAGATDSWRWRWMFQNERRRYSRESSSDTGRRLPLSDIGAMRDAGRSPLRLLLDDRTSRSRAGGPDRRRRARGPARQTRVSNCLCMGSSDGKETIMVTEAVKPMAGDVAGNDNGDVTDSRSLVDSLVASGSAGSPVRTDRRRADRAHRRRRSAGRAHEGRPGTRPAGRDDVASGLRARHGGGQGRAAGMRTRATVRVPRRCPRRWERRPCRFPTAGTARSPRGWCPGVPGGWADWTR